MCHQIEDGFEPNPNPDKKHSDWGYFNYLLKNYIALLLFLKIMEQLELNVFLIKKLIDEKWH